MINPIDFDIFMKEREAQRVAKAKDRQDALRHVGEKRREEHKTLSEEVTEKTTEEVALTKAARIGEYEYTREGVLKFYPEARCRLRPGTTSWYDVKAQINKPSGYRYVIGKGHSEKEAWLNAGEYIGRIGGERKDPLAIINDSSRNTTKINLKKYRVGIGLTKTRTAKTKAAIYWPSEEAENDIHEFEAEDDADAYYWLCKHVLPEDQRPISGWQTLPLILKSQQPKDGTKQG